MTDSSPTSGNGALELLPDLPNWNVDEGTFGPYADVLSDAIRGTPPPFTLGIFGDFFGDYGSGKTTLMRMIQKRLDGCEDTPTVWFNAWRFQREAHLILPLLETIRFELRALQARKGNWVAARSPDSRSPAGRLLQPLQPRRLACGREVPRALVRR